MSRHHATRSLVEHEIHDVLRNERRTRVLKHLKREQRTVTLRELSEELASMETGESPPPRNTRESVYNSLHQTHLPKLDELGIVEYERDRKLIDLLDGAQQVEVYMEVVPNNDVTWATYFFALGMLSMLVVALSGLGVLVFAALSAAVWAGGFFGVFVLSALFWQYKHEGRYLGRLH